ncbi:hypothetical protein AOQ84DRAFT_363849 [Glonium stellatum]|uniref:Pyridoxal phosphate homeostasis protein n=1 Tax=Glonium stellatum TaxID=574774 RepID=A0A8E2F197_9PEZI|nr:hypothetical protein AOQ84DRAFT_363849 [Glonium stellatum]
MAEEMQVNPQRAKQLAESLTHITQRIQSANKSSKPIRLIAVSKLKPATDILALHQPPVQQLHFGENYVQELLQKASLLPRSVRWHFIGALQSNKCKSLAEQIPNLWCVSSVDSVKKADALEKGRAAFATKLAAKRTNGESAKNAGGSSGNEAAEGEEAILRVMVQVNTSGEESKSGVEPSDALALCRHVRSSCPHLRLTGLMTIGAIARSQATTPENENEDFIMLRNTRDQIAKELGILEGELELSMGMSADFDGAVAMGSDEVRIGSDIFGQRPPKKDAVVVEKG